MSFEVEVKFRVRDHHALRRVLAELGAVEGAEVQHEDHYLAHPSRDFATTDEALRLRKIGDENRVTYKGPKRGGPTKTREEVEISYAGGADALGGMRTVFDRLGFLPVATVTKTRRPYTLRFQGRKLEVALDLAGPLGAFAEVEALAGGESDLLAAQGAVLALAERLGLSEVEPRSYLRMTLEGASLTPPPEA